MQIRPVAAEPLEIQPMVVHPTDVQPIQVLPTQATEARAPEILHISTPQVQGSLAQSPQIHTPQTAKPILYQPQARQPEAEETLLPKSSEIAEALRLVFSRLHSAGKAAWLSFVSVGGRVRERGLQTARSLEFREGLSRAGMLSQNLVRGGVVRTSRYARTTGNAVSALSRASVSRLGQMSANVRTVSTTATTDVAQLANTRPSIPSRIRVLLRASALQAKVITAQQLSAWRIRRERAAIDSRFWASMTMAAIAAVIALVIVSVVPHYDAKTLPSRILNTNPSVDANVAPVAAPAHVQKTVTPRKTATVTSTQTAAAKTDSAKVDSTKSATNPKPKHVVNDDYVAPNTYKYYGTGSKASR
jgi:hypothetical protein